MSVVDNFQPSSDHWPGVRVTETKSDLASFESKSLLHCLADRLREAAVDANQIQAHQNRPFALAILQCARAHPQVRKFVARPVYRDWA